MSKSEYITPGSIWIEIALWIIFFPAGIIYSIWRITNKRPAYVTHERRNGRVDTYFTDDGQPPRGFYHRDGDLWVDRKHGRLFKWRERDAIWEELNEER